MGPRLVLLSPDGRDEEQREREENILLREVGTVEPPRLNSSGTVEDSWRSSRRENFFFKIFLSQRLSYSHCKPVKRMLCLEFSGKLDLVHAAERKNEAGSFGAKISKGK